jgi:hypothetical protein
MKFRVMKGEEVVTVLDENEFDEALFHEIIGELAPRFPDIPRPRLEAVDPVTLEALPPL